MASGSRAPWVRDTTPPTAVRPAGAPGHPDPVRYVLVYPGNRVSRHYSWREVLTQVHASRLARVVMPAYVVDYLRPDIQLQYPYQDHRPVGSP